MLLTVIAVLLPPFFLFSGLRHGVYVAHLLVMAALSWWRFPSFSYPLWHPYYPYFIGLCHFLSINLLCFLAYGWDKQMARTGGWRIPEKTLHALALIGGTLGAFAGSRFFRHKTIKKQFRQMFLIISTLQVLVVLAAYLLV